MSTSRLILWGGLLGLLIAGCMGARTVARTDKEKADEPGKASLSEIQLVSGSDQQPFLVRLETSKGDIVIEVHPEWAPRGARRFRELVEAGFYDECRFFRVVKGFMVQVGMNGDPDFNAQWSKKKLRDDPVIQSNKPGFVTFAKTGAPDSRTTQFFINYGNNSALDRQGFAPFGKVIEGMDIAQAIESRYGEEPQQDKIERKGNAYLKNEFPKLDYIVKATIE
ncbi:MAG: peptidylprolyl isomerase [Planctomycetaceae bacterium]